MATTSERLRTGRGTGPAPVAALPRLGSAPVATRLVQVFAVVLFVFPSFAVFKPIGAAAFPAGLVGMAAFGLWALWTALGRHDPLRARTPVRVAFGAVWVSSLLSYVALQFRSRTDVEILGGDRWLLFLTALTGVAFVASECLRSLQDVRRVLRALVWGGAFTAVVAILQYFFAYNATPFLGNLLPGFSFDGDLGAIGFRAGLNRVPGTMVHPIELGTVAAMLLPLSIYLLIHDTERSRARRLVPVLLILACVPLSVSRSATLAVGVAMVIFILGLSAQQRLVGLAAVPVVIGGVFFMLPGTITTLVDYFSLGRRDPSIATRTDDYAMVEQYVRERPYFGRGGGTYLTTDLLEILDNQYLKWTIEFGLVGLAALAVFFFLVPAAAAFIARSRAPTGEMKVLNGALGAAIVSAAISSATFDSLSFPVFTCVYALLVGLVGASWRLAGVKSRWAGER